MNAVLIEAKIFPNGKSKFQIDLEKCEQIHLSICLSQDVVVLLSQKIQTTLAGGLLMS